jgi:hypothetical protein
MKGVVHCNERYLETHSSNERDGSHAAKRCAQPTQDAASDGCQRSWTTLLGHRWDCQEGRWDRLSVEHVLPSAYCGSIMATSLSQRRPRRVQCSNT